MPDPLGGSWFLERLTDQVEGAAQDYIRRIDEMGGMIPAIEKGFPQSEIANASYHYQHGVEIGDNIIVGVNRFVEPESEPIELLQIDESAQARQATVSATPTGGLCVLHGVACHG